MSDLEQDFQKALALTREHKIEAAIVIYEQILAQTPGHSPSHYNLALLQAKLGEHALAEKHLRALLEYEPEFAAGFFQLAQILLIRHQTDEAIAQLKHAIALDPSFVDAHHLLACTAMREHHDLLATKHFQAVLKFRPEHPPAHMNFGLLKLNQNDIQGALHYLNMAIKLDPTLVEAHYNLGVIAMQQGQLSQAMDAMTKTLDRAPDHFAANYNLGLLYKNQQHYQLALHYLEKAHALKPDDAHAQFLVDALKAGENPANMPDNFVRDLFDHYAQYYDEHMQASLDFQVPKLLRQALDQTLTHPLTNSYVLDLGCGTGLSGQHFKDIAQTLIGVDIAPNMLAQAEKRGIYNDLHEQDIIGFLQAQPEQHIDLIIASDVLGYFGQLDTFFQQAQRVLRPGGYLLFSVETCEHDNFKLQKSVRYAHSEAYITQLAEQLHLKILLNKKVTLRQQAKKPVLGRVFLLEK